MSDLNVKITIGAALLGSHQQVMAAVQKSFRDYAREIGASIKQHVQLSPVMRRSEEQIARLKTRQQELNQQLSESRGRWIASGAAIYGASRMIKAAAAIEEQGVYLGTVVNAPDRDAAVGASLSHARSFARRSLATESEVLDIEYALNSGGLDAAASRAGTEFIHKAAKVMRGESGQVGEVFVTTLNNLGRDMVGSTEEKMQRIGNVLTKTQFKFQIRDFNQLGESMKYAAAGMAGAKVPLEQGAAVIGQLNTAGLQGSMAGTAFNGVLRNMTKAADELGFEMIRGTDGSLDFIATMEGMKESLDGLDIDERGDLLQKLFGDEGKRGVVPLLNQLDDLKKAYAEVGDAAGSNLVNDEYARFLNSSSGQMTMFGQNLKMIGNVLAGSVLPGLNLVLKPIGMLFGGIAWAIEKFPPLGWVIGGVTAAIVGVAAGTMIWTAAQWALNAALLANPVTWIIAGIIAVGLAIGALVKNWDRVWGAIKTGAGVVWEFLKKMFAWTPLGLVMQAWKPTLEFIGAAWEKIKAVGRFFGMGAKEAVAGAATAVALSTTPLAADALPPPANSGSSVSTVNAPITINAAPGQSGEDIAKTVSRELDARQRANAARQRARLYD